MTRWPTIFLLAVLFFISINFSELELRLKNSRVKTVPTPPMFDVQTETLTKPPGDDGRIHGRIFQKYFNQEGSTSGRSPDEISVKFSGPAEIHGILMSVDCWKSTRLVEFAAGLNQKPAYQTKGDHEMLMHVSFATNNEAGKIDEQVWFPKPFLMSPSDSLNIGAWIQNVSSKKQGVSPEMIVYYTWAKP
ncbi:MAG: hypothetical protein HYU99_09165 [Deltaproteobacteria bacterium]|nr:hypothetical protein [Deltaproteobacteria bacterium]